MEELRSWDKGRKEGERRRATCHRSRCVKSARLAVALRHTVAENRHRVRRNSVIHRPNRARTSGATIAQEPRMVTMGHLRMRRREISSRAALRFTPHVFTLSIAVLVGALLAPKRALASGAP